jgi:cell division protein FtsZ
MGGGTGTGAAPVVAEIAKELGILTVAVVTKPFPFEGRKRLQVAEHGIAELGKHVDSLITIPNEKLLAVLGKNMSLLNAFSAANDVLLNAVAGIAELITRPGLINVDFADVRTVMMRKGIAMMGMGSGTGENRARDAAEAAIQSPLLEDISLTGAEGILVNITAGMNLTIGEFEEVGMTIKEVAREDATVVVGTVIDPELQDELRVTVVATGLAEKRAFQAKPEQPIDIVSIVRPIHDASVARPQPERRENEGGGFARGERAKQYVESARREEIDYLDIPAFLRRQAD